MITYKYYYFVVASNGRYAKVEIIKSLKPKIIKYLKYKIFNVFSEWPWLIWFKKIKVFVIFIINKRRIKDEK